ncbi:MAG TPA: SRPBCC family protein [Patescibacteria group bacterium]|nr:SRPBCC family protein [Patescibacteria group bacterium]
MTTIVNEIFINRKPEDVFDYCVDMTHELEWNPKAKSIEKISTGPLSVGTQFKAKWQGGPEVIVECTKYDRPKEWVNHNGGALTITSSYTLTPKDGGTLLVSKFEAEPNGLMKVLFPLMKSSFAKQFPQNLVFIKKKLES